MGQRGPAPTPTALKVLKGNPGKRPLNGAEPRFDATAPKAPKTLTKEARAHWKRIIALMEQAPGLLTAADVYVLARYCEDLAMLDDAQQKRNDSGPVIKGPFGPILNPLDKLIGDLSARCLSREIQLGLTPSARSRLHVQQPTAKKKSVTLQLIESAQRRPA